LKFVGIGKDYQEYRLSIPEPMLTKAIKQFESYQMFIKEIVDVLEESEPKPELVKRRVKKKVTLSTNDNIISNDPNTALELGKSISQTKAKEEEATRQVHDTHARIVTEFVPESAKKKPGGRSSKSVVIQDTLSAPKSKPATSKTKLKEQESEHSKEDKLDDEEKDEKEGDADDDEDDETESDEDDIYHYKILVRKDEDEEMINTEVNNSNKGDEEITDAAKADAEKTSKGTKETHNRSYSEIFSAANSLGTQDSETYS
nr:hypothetical protein [Tanacetum cinerariifolium]